LGLVESRSSGLIGTADGYGCDFDGNLSRWGCQTRKWNYTTGPYARQFCLDSTFNGGGKFMWWTGAPVPVDRSEFSMRTADGNPANDPKTYIPGRNVAIYIRSLQFDTPFKGLLLYAKNSSGKVGDWNIPWEASPMYSAYGVQICQQSVMHVNAEDKPILSKFNFIAPEAGTGTITIKAMIKTGPPNPTDWGNFYIMPEITLTEAQPNDARKWALLEDGVTCQQYCANSSQDACSDVTLGTTIDGVDPSPLDQIYPCHGAIFHDCSGNPRVQLPEGFCTYHPANCTSGASCTLPSSSATGPLFCLCGAPPPPPQIGASAHLVPGLGALAALLLVNVWGAKSQAAWSTLALLFAALPLANAHNWMEGTRGRASNLGANQFCSPTFPQLNRNEIHLQVAKDQNFVVEWAAAHGDYTYWIVIHDDARGNVSKITRALMDNWLANCPTGGFANTTATGMKYHRFAPNRNLSSQSLVNGATPTAANYSGVFFPDPIYNGTIYDQFSLKGGVSGRPDTFYQRLNFNANSVGPDFISPFNASLYPNTMLAQYRPQYLANDRRCSYTNASNPWIETIHRYQHHDVSSSFATALISIPARKGPGRYQLHYKWSSYCDTIDVDVQPNTVAAPYGSKTNESVEYNIGHHCWFPKPRNVGQCIEVVNGPSQCQALCSADPGCKGFQMLPLQLDASQGNDFGAFPGPSTSFVPWSVNVNVNTTGCKLSQFANAPKKGAMVCYPIYQFQDDYGSARPLWSFTEDVDHQGFYGTCYIKPRRLAWLDFTPIDNDPPKDFRFLSKCVPCDNIGQNLTNPRWGPQQNYCTDCSKNPAAPRSLPAVPKWTFVATGTFTQPAHWLSPAGSPIAFADECALLALRDPTCSKYVMFSDARAQRFGGLIPLLPPTQTNVNGTAAFKLINTSGSHWSYNDLSLTYAYYRTCACLDNATATSPPAIDPNSTAMACDKVLPKDCVFKNFSVYSLP